MEKLNFIISEYEILSQRTANADSYSGTFVSIYFVFQTALITGLNLSPSLISEVQNNVQYSSVVENLPSFLSLFGIGTTIWAFVMVTGYLFRIQTMAERMREIEEVILGDTHSTAFIGRMMDRPYRKLLHALLGGTTYLILLLFMIFWLAVTFF